MATVALAHTGGGECGRESKLTIPRIGDIELLETITAHPEVFPRGRGTKGQIATEFYKRVFGGMLFIGIIALLMVILLTLRIGAKLEARNAALSALYIFFYHRIQQYFCP